jgi:hypothetical protein
MKNLLLLLFATLLLISCEEAAKNELEVQENTAADFESGRVYGPVDYNDGLLAESTLLDVKMAMLEDLDAADVPRDEMVAACKDAMAEYDRVISALNSVEAYGVKGEEFKQAVIDYAKTTGRIFNMYNDYADLLSIPDSEWTEEEASIWDETYNAIFEDYIAANDNCIEVQEAYASLNDMRLEYSGSTAEEIYEESITTE